MRLPLAPMRVRRPQAASSSAAGVHALSDVLCDVRHCTDPCAVWVDGIAHCWTHLEDVWERWQVPEGSIVREHWEPIPYRLDAYGMELAYRVAHRRAGGYYSSRQNNDDGRG